MNIHASTVYYYYYDPSRKVEADIIIISLQVEADKRRSNNSNQSVGLLQHPELVLEVPGVLLTMLY